MLELELITFGILSGTSDIAVNDTRTAQLFSAISKRLPSAQNGNSAKSTETKGSSTSVSNLSSEKKPARLTSGRKKDGNSTSPGVGDTSAASSPL